MLEPREVPVRRQADPSPPVLEAEKLFLVKRLLVFEHEIGGPTQLVGKDR